MDLYLLSFDSDTSVTHKRRMVSDCTPVSLIFDLDASVIIKSKMISSSYPRDRWLESQLQTTHLMDLSSCMSAFSPDIIINKQKKRSIAIHIDDGCQL